MKSSLKKRIALILFLLIQYCTAWSQDTLSPYLITSDTTLLYKFTKAQYQILPDKTGKLNIDEVKSAVYSKQFFTKGKTPDSIETNVNTNWYRYAVKNTLEKEFSVMLHTNQDYSDFYVIRDGQKQTHYKNGWEVPWKEKDGLQADNVIPLTLAADEQVVIYNRIKNRRPGTQYSFEVKLFNKDKYVFKQLTERQGNFDLQSIFFAIFAGFCLLGGLFNFLLFIIDRQKIHLYFSLFILNIAFILSPLWTVVVLRYYPSTAPAVAIITGTALAIFFIQFTRYYFQTFIHTPKWDKVLIGLMLIQCLPLLMLFNIVPEGTLNFVMFSAILVSCFGTLILFFLLKHKTVKPFAIAILPFGLLLIVAFMLAFLQNLFKVVIPEMILSMSGIAFYFSIAWPVLFFTWILFKQYDWQKREIIQHALDTERLQKEKEIERNALIEKQKAELEIKVQERTAELRQSIADLQSTQKQLIQSEKMASLGELTAGIAHEIQNPLNFVNNFSEISMELIEELKTEKAKDKAEQNETLEVELLDDISKNLQKITHHGKRADSIVKGMLQHSRASSHQKEFADVNKLADEYLRLAYHGLRAKDKSFNAELITNFDINLPLAKIVPQDIGRVFLNLLTNAFYAVQDRNKKEKEINKGTTFKPTVKLSTSADNGFITILVEDNGSGIPDHIKDKVMQPFFTTKPTGEGTGLGLSMSYDIVVEAHGGTIKINSDEGEFTEFSITIPIEPKTTIS